MNFNLDAFEIIEFVQNRTNIDMIFILRHMSVLQMIFIHINVQYLGL